MANEFEKILLSLLENYQNNPEMDIEKIITEECQAQGVSEACVDKVNQANQLLDATQDKYDELAEAKKNYVSTQKWLGKEINRILDKPNLTDDEKLEITDAIQKTLEQNTENQLNVEEE